MFQFPRFPSVRLCIQRPIRPLARTGVAPFGFDWLIARLQLPSHVSPFSAPFIGLWPHRHPPYTLLRLARLLNLPASFRAQHDTIHGRIQHDLLVRFGKIEVHHDMRLSRCIFAQHLTTGE